MTGHQSEAVSLPTDLLPCPFCGSSEQSPVESVVQLCHMEYHREHHPEGDTWTVQCDNCTATMGEFPDPDEAITAWNTRESRPVERSGPLEMRIAAAISFASRNTRAPDTGDGAVERLLKEARIADDCHQMMECDPRDILAALATPPDPNKVLVEALRKAALDLHEAAGRFACISKLNPQGCSELTREAAVRADTALKSVDPSNAEVS